MTIPIVINIMLLIYFKYANFIIENINCFMETEYALINLILPLGISFFSFQQIAYIVAVYRNEITSISLLDYVVYILYFPKLLMGPLIEPVDFFVQLNNHDFKKVNWDNVACGLKIFCFGLLKKMLLADTFAKAVTWGYTNIDSATSMDWLLLMLFYTFQIYFDFSGYSDMAVGCSYMLNITLPINFDSPYKALSIRDFWKRWHVSLTRFLTNYIYIPLGGSKKGKLFTYVNTLIVFLISGIWHGANWTFILWGILHGVFSILDRIFEKVEEKVFEPVRWFVTFVICNVLWLLFRSDSINQWFFIIKKICFVSDTNFSEELVKIFTLQEADLIYDILPCVQYLSLNNKIFWMLVFLVSSFVICLLPENNYKKIKENSFVTMLLAAIAFVWGFICLSSESTFVYFDF